METQPPIEPDILERLEKVANPEDSGVRLDALDGAEPLDLGGEAMRVLDMVSENEDSVEDMKKGALFEEVKDDLKIIATEDTDNEIRNAKIVLLRRGKGLTIPEDIDYATNTFEREKLLEAVLVIENNNISDSRWGSVEGAKAFLREDINVSFEEEKSMTEEEINKDSVEKIISSDEHGFFNTFVTGFKEDEFDGKFDYISKLMIHSGLKERLDDYQRSYGADENEKLFLHAQYIYFRHVLGPDGDDFLAQMNEQSGKIQAYARLIESDPNYSDPAHINELEKLKRGTKGDIYKRISKIALPKVPSPTKKDEEYPRGWFEWEKINAVDFLEKTFSLVEADKKVDGDIGVVVRFFENIYDNAGSLVSRVDLLPFKKKETNVPLIDSVMRFHDFARSLDNSGYDNVDLELKNTIDSDLQRIMSIRAKIGSDEHNIFPYLIEKFVHELNERRSLLNGQVLNVYDPTLNETFFDKYIKGNFADSRAVMAITRDMVRIFGIDAAYSTDASMINEDANKKGSYLRDTINFVAKKTVDLRKKNPDALILLEDISSGVVPFVNKDLDVKTLSVDDGGIEVKLSQMAGSKEFERGDYKVWLDGIKKAKDDTLDKEGKFLVNPTIDSFLNDLLNKNKILVDLTYKNQIRNRLYRLFKYLGKKNPDALEASINSTFYKEKKYNGMGIFNNYEEVNTWYHSATGDNLVREEVMTSSLRSGAKNATKRFLETILPFMK